MPRPSLTRVEAEARAAAVSVDGYDIALDLRAAETFTSTTVARFRAAPGSSTFLDATTRTVHSIELNGRSLDPATQSDGWRIRLDDLDAENVVRVESTCAYTNTGEGLHRFVDPVDGETYLYTEFAVAEANRVFAVFDQPDMKASFTFSITAPAYWQVLSNASTPAPAPQGDSATWSFEPGPVMSSYIVAVVAGPYAAWQGSAASSDGREVPLGLYTRASLAQYADPDMMFDTVRAGLEFYESTFGVPYPFGKYDQIFVPEYNWGAMENVGAVTFNESYLFRSRVSEARLEQRAIVVLHELSHMWFGNSVTMKWWNDVWLNESFATWASTHATSLITEFSGVWASFTSAQKTRAAMQDQLPSTHPIVAEINDLGDVEGNFDGITYDKGASVLKQLVAWVGLDEFQRGVGAYLRAHAFGNATLADLLRELETASGRELDAWSKLWLETAGVNTLRLNVETDEAGVITSAHVEQTAASAYPTLRPHRIAIGGYEHHGERMRRTTRIELDVDGARTEVCELVGHPKPALLLVNDDDLTYAKIRLDADSFTAATRHLADLDDPVARALVLGAVWDAVRDAELDASSYVRLVLATVGRESQSSTLGLALVRLELALDHYLAPAHRAAAGAAAADAMLGLLVGAEAGSDAQLQFAKSFTRLAATATHATVLAELFDGSRIIAGLDVDLDLRWDIVTARATLGAASGSEIDAMLTTDDTAKGLQLAETAHAARPDSATKAAAWRRVATDTSLSNDVARAIAAGWHRGDSEHSRTIIDEYFEMLTRVWNTRGFTMGSLIVRQLYPAGLIDASLENRTREWLEAHPDAAPALRRIVSEQHSELMRALAAVARDRSEHSGATQ